MDGCEPGIAAGGDVEVDLFVGVCWGGQGFENEVANSAAVWSVYKAQRIEERGVGLELELEIEALFRRTVI